MTWDEMPLVWREPIMKVLRDLRVARVLAEDPDEDEDLEPAEVDTSDLNLELIDAAIAKLEASP